MHFITTKEDLHVDQSKKATPLIAQSASTRGIQRNTLTFDHKVFTANLFESHSHSSSLIFSLQDNI